MRYASFILIPATLALAAQAPAPTKAAPKTAAKPAAKLSPENQNARLVFQQVLDAVNNSWFGAPYKEINAVDLDGSLNIDLSAAALNAKVEQLSQGEVKGGLTKGAKASLRVKGTYFANGDFKTELNGDFGNLLYTRVGNSGFLYSKELNTYTSKVEPQPSDAPLSFLGWFRQTVNDIKAVYVDGSAFKGFLGKEESVGGRTLQTVIFVAPTSAYDPKKREQSLTDSLAFWKRGRLEVGFDKTTKLPYRLDFTNESQGIHTRMDITYAGTGRLQSVSVTNQSKGMEGPGSLSITYGADGLMNRVAGELSSQNKRVAFDMGLTWAKGKKMTRVVPPPTATKKGRDEMESLLLVALAGEILDLQRNGLNLRSVTLTNK